MSHNLSGFSASSPQLFDTRTDKNNDSITTTSDKNNDSIWFLRVVKQFSRQVDDIQNHNPHMLPTAIPIDALHHPDADPVSWVSDRLAEFQRTAATDQQQEQQQPTTRFLASPGIDKYLQTLQAAADVGMKDLSVAAEVGQRHTLQNVGRIKAEAVVTLLELSACRAQLKALTERLQAVGTDQLSGISVLNSMDLLKRRLVSCRTVFNVLHQWDLKARELEVLLETFNATSAKQISASVDEEVMESSLANGGESSSPLVQAISHLVEMKEAVSSAALATNPQFEGKLKWLSRFETRLLDACCQQVNNIVASNNARDFKQYAQVGGEMSKLQ